MTEFDIKEMNPWKDIKLTKLYADSPIYALDKDQDMIADFHKNLNDGDVKNRLILNIPPEPWQGNPLKAKVIFLSLNPGYIDNVNKKLAKVLQSNEHILKGINDFKENTLKLESCSFLPESNNEEPIGVKDAVNMLGDWYWEKGFRQLREKCCIGTYTESRFYQDVAIIQSHAYSSEKYEHVFPRGGKLLHSQEFTKELINYILQTSENTIFVIMRAVKVWKKILGIDIEGDKRFLIKESKSMSQAISSKNLGENKFIEICKNLNPQC